MSRRFPGRPYTPPAAPLTGVAAAARTLRAALSAGRAFLVRPATLLIPAALLAGLVIGSVGTANELGALGRLEVLTPNESTALIAAADRFETQLAVDGIAFTAFQRPFRNGSPANDAGFAGYTIGTITPTLDYQEISIISDVVAATFNMPGERLLFRRNVSIHDASGDIIYWTGPVAVGTPGRTPEGLGSWGTGRPITGFGADPVSLRLLPTLLRALEITSQTSSADGGTEFVGRAPTTSYPGAVMSNGLGLTAPTIVVMIHLDANGSLDRYALRAINLNTLDIEYVTEVQLTAPTALPTWVKEIRP